LEGTSFQDGSPPALLNPPHALTLVVVAAPGGVKASLSGRVMYTGTKFATSAFQHDDPVTLNAQSHGHSFIDEI
jgi:hypothetical protein